MRKLTVSTLRRQWGQTYRTREGYFPFIRMSGNWLAEAGFAPGCRISVEIFAETSSLIIRKEKSE
jgi:hypothetical protein